jgi:hypothetical protein
VKDTAGTVQRLRRLVLRIVVVTFEAPERAVKYRPVVGDLGAGDLGRTLR